MERIEEEKTSQEPITRILGIVKTKESGDSNYEKLQKMRPKMRKKSSLINLMEDENFGIGVEPPSFIRPDENEGVEGGVVIITERGGDFADGTNDQMEMLGVKKEGSSNDSFDNLSFMSQQFK